MEVMGNINHSRMNLDDIRKKMDADILLVRTPLKGQENNRCVKEVCDFNKKYFGTLLVSNHEYHQMISQKIRDLFEAKADKIDGWSEATNVKGETDEQKKRRNILTKKFSSLEGRSASKRMKKIEKMHDLAEEMSDKYNVLERTSDSTKKLELKLEIVEKRRYYQHEYIKAFGLQDSIEEEKLALVKFECLEQKEILLQEYLRNNALNERKYNEFNNQLTKIRLDKKKAFDTLINVAKRSNHGYMKIDKRIDKLNENELLGGKKFRNYMLYFAGIDPKVYLAQAANTTTFGGNTVVADLGPEKIKKHIIERINYLDKDVEEVGKKLQRKNRFAFNKGVKEALKDLLEAGVEDNNLDIAKNIITVIRLSSEWSRNSKDPDVKRYNDRLNKIMMQWIYKNKDTLEVFNLGRMEKYYIHLFYNKYARNKNEFEKDIPDIDKIYGKIDEWYDIEEKMSGENNEEASQTKEKYKHLASVLLFQDRLNGEHRTSQKDVNFRDAVNKYLKTVISDKKDKTGKKTVKSVELLSFVKVLYDSEGDETVINEYITEKLGEAGKEENSKHNSQSQINNDSNFVNSDKIQNNEKYDSEVIEKTIRKQKKKAVDRKKYVSNQISYNEHVYNKIESKPEEKEDIKEVNWIAEWKENRNKMITVAPESTKEDLELPNLNIDEILNENNKLKK